MHLFAREIGGIMFVHVLRPFLRIPGWLKHSKRKLIFFINFNCIYNVFCFFLIYGFLHLMSKQEQKSINKKKTNNVIKTIRIPKKFNKSQNT